MARLIFCTKIMEWCGGFGCHSGDCGNYYQYGTRELKQKLGYEKK